MRDDTPMASPDTLLSRYRTSGDVDALGALFDQTAPTLYRIALSLLPDAASAEDALQETWLAALGNLERHDPERPVVPWLVGILRVMVLRARRSAARRPDPTRLESESARGDADDTLADSETVRRALEDLPEPYRSASLLRWRYGLEPAEIAHVRDEAPGTTRSLLSRARERLGRILKRSPALALLGPAPRGLTVVKQTVLAEAAHLVPVTAGVLAVGGVLMTKKALALAGLALLLLVGAIGVVAGGLLDRDREDSPAPEVELGVSTVVAPEEEEGATRLEGRGSIAYTPPILPDGPHVTGRVVDADGAPVAGARVLSAPHDLRRPLRIEEADAEARVHHTVTDERGRFALPLSDTWPEYAVGAEAEGYPPGAVYVARPGDDVTVHLPRASAIQGHVRDVDGDPIEGAEVRVLGFVEALAFERGGVSAADGSYRIEGLPSQSDPGMPAVPLVGAWMEARAARYAPLWLSGLQGSSPAGFSFAEDGGSSTVDLVLLRGATVEGRVVHHGTEEPAAGVHVVLFTREGYMSIGRAGGASWSNPHAPRLLDRATTDAKGRFSFAHVPALGSHVGGRGMPGRGFGQVLAWGDGLAPGGASVDRGRDGSTQEVTVSVLPAIEARGRVVDAAGQGVEGARVWATVEGVERQAWVPELLRDEVSTAYANADENGRYRLGAVAAAPGATVTVEGRIQDPSALGSTADHGRVEVVAPEGGPLQVPDLLLALDSSRQTVFDVRDEAGSPIWGAGIGHGRGFESVVRTGRDGRARITWAGSTDRPIQPFPMLVTAHGHGGEVIEIAPRNDVQEVVQVVLGPSRALAGRVTKPDGSAARAVVVVLDGTIPLEQLLQDRPHMPIVQHVAGRAHVFANQAADAEGRFRVEGLPAGPYHVVAHRSDLVEERYELVTDSVSDVQEGEEGVRLTLPEPRTPPPGLLEGRVVDDETGRDISQFAARLTSGRQTRYGQVHEPGRFRIQHLPPATWTLQVTAPDYVTERVEGIVVTAEPGETIRIRLRKGIEVVGRARGPEDVNLRGRTLRFERWPLSSDSRDTREAALDDQGRYRASGFEPGTYRVSTHPSLRRPDDPVLVVRRRLDLDAAPGPATENLELVPAGTLQVTTSGERLPPPYSPDRGTEEQRAYGEACRLTVRDAEGGLVLEQAGVYQGYAGRASYLRVLPGTYIVRLEAPDEAPVERQAVVVEGETTVVEFAVPTPSTEQR